MEIQVEAQETSATATLGGTLALAGGLLAGCGGGGSGAGTGGTGAGGGGTPPPAAISAMQASRFLSQAAFGGTEADLAQVQALGYRGWIDAQMVATGTQSHWDWMVANGYAVTANINNFAGVDNTLWRKLMGSPDALRQRLALAWSEIFVISMAGLPVAWRGMAVAAYMDRLEANAFANFRTLLERVTLSCGMGVYLNMRGNQKEDATTGRQPDENYAREVMQLFVIGLHELNQDGSVRTAGGAPLETYTQASVTGLAKVLTGWDFDAPVAGSPEHMRRPMAFIASRHSTSAKNFLGVTIPAGSLDGPAELRLALDTLFNHANAGPFIGRQLIQRLVTSNPSPAYVGRVAAAFANNGAGVRGDVQAVVRAILLDDEARTPTSTDAGGRLREPVCRLVQWARSFGATAATGQWTIGDTSNPSTRLGQSPLRAGSVFNFFRPGYVPPSTPMGARGLMAPEFQLANESTLVGYANWMQVVIQLGRGDVAADYSAFVAAATDPGLLFDRLNTLLAGAQLGAAARNTVVTALSSIDGSTDAGRLRRVQAAVLLVMVSPEYLVLK